MLKVVKAKENHETGKQPQQSVFKIQQLLLHFVDNAFLNAASLKSVRNTLLALGFWPMIILPQR